MTHRTLTATLLLSTGLHLAVLLPYVSREQILLVDSPDQPYGHFNMVMSQAVIAQEQPVPVEKQPMATISKKPATTAAASIKSNESAAPEEETAVKTASITPSTAAVGDRHQNEQLDHDVLEYLHAQFRVRFQYPLLARKRGWSGEVVIALNVNHHGLIDNIAVKKSSGYPILDDNAVQTFRAIGGVTPAIQSRINNNHHLSIPVVYKLTGG